MHNFLSGIEKIIQARTIVSAKLVLKDYAMQISIVDYDKPIVFTFDNMDTTNDKTIKERSGWGA